MTILPPLDESSRAYLNNVLNEVLYGFRIDCEKEVGARREDVLRLFQDLARPDVNRGERLSVAGVKLLLKCSDLCLREFGAEEFETRLGEPVAFALRVNGSLASSMDVLPVSV